MGPFGPQNIRFVGFGGLFQFFFWGLFQFWGVIFGFLKNLSSILEPVMHLSMGQNCGKICFGAYFPDLGFFGGIFEFWG